MSAAPVLTEPPAAWDVILLAARHGDLQPMGSILQKALPELEKAAARCVPHRFCHQLLPGDLVQEAMVKLCKHLVSFPGHSEQELLSYLSAMVRNTARNAVRDLNRKKRAACLTVSLDVGEQRFELADSRPSDPAREAQREITVDQFRSLLPLLSMEDHLLMTWWFSGYSLDRIADCWGISVPALRKRLACISASLRQLAKEHGLYGPRKGGDTSRQERAQAVAREHQVGSQFGA